MFSVIVAFLVMLFMSFPGTGFALSVEATSDADGQSVGVRVSSDDGQLIRTIKHPAVALEEIYGPHLVGQTWMYAVGASILELDSQGRVARRTHYPALIGGLELEGDKLSVLLKTRWGGSETNAKVLHTGNVASYGPWDGFAFVDRDLPVSTPKSTLASDWTPLAFSDLNEAEENDLTSPLFPAYLGLGYSVLLQNTESNLAFKRASDRSSTWFDDVRLCGVMERAQRADLAQGICGRAVGRMPDAGVRPEALWNMIFVVAITGDLRKAMEAALQNKDIESAHRIAGHFRAIVPRAEGVELAWLSLSKWLVAHGAKDKAKVWDAAYDDVISSHPARSSTEGTRMVDLALLFKVGGILALAVAGIALGVSSARRDVGQKGWRKWLPIPNLLEAISFTIFILAILWASFSSSRDVVLIEEYASMPNAAGTDGLASPEVLTWLDGFEATPMVQEVRDHSRQELNLMKAGLPASGKKLRVDLVPDVILERATARAGISPTAVFEVAGHDNPNPIMPFLFILTTLLNVLFFAVIGKAAARLVGPNNKALMLIPGVYSGALGVWVTAAIVVGSIYILTPVGSIMTRLSTPDSAKYYGFEGLGVVSDLKPDLGGMIFLLVLGLLAHFISVGMNWKKLRGKFRDPATAMSTSVHQETHMDIK